jgi:hypothetical protein
MGGSVLYQLIFRLKKHSKFGRQLLVKKTIIKIPAAMVMEKESVENTATGRTYV